MAAAAIDVLIPVKDFSIAKERLAPILSPALRSGVARAMFLDVLDAVKEVEPIRHVWVVSGSPEVLRLAGENSALPIDESEDANAIHDLNGALEYGRRTLMSITPSAEALLVIPADLPAASADAFAALLQAPAAGPSVRICGAPDGGTNALVLRPPDAIPFRYGRNSALAHAREAHDRGLRYEYAPNPLLAIDLDTPEDVRAWLRTAPRGRTAAVLRNARIV